VYFEYICWKFAGCVLLVSARTKPIMIVLSVVHEATTQGVQLGGAEVIKRTYVVELVIATA